MESNESLCQQEANAFLRERFLNVLSSINNKNCKVKMYENAEVTATIKAFDLDFENVIVENLKTPLPNNLKAAILRTSDILTISIE